MKLRQILFNLVSNAIKFTEAGSVKVTINAEAISDTRTSLTLNVADTGIGISKQKVDNMMSPNASIQRSTGMDFISRLVENLNGKMAIHSEVGKGSLFTITISDISVYDTNSDEAKDIIDMADTTSAARKRDELLKEFVTLLRGEIIPAYRQLKTTMSFSKLDSFAADFRKTAVHYGIEKAVRIADEIRHSIKNLDINSITINMRKVENYLIDLAKNVNNE